MAWHARSSTTRDRAAGLLQEATTGNLSEAMRRNLRVLPPLAALATGTVVPAALLPNGWTLFEVALGVGVPAVLAANRLRPQPDFAVLAAMIAFAASVAGFVIWVALNPLY